MFPNLRPGTYPLTRSHRARLIDPRTGQLLEEFAADRTNSAHVVFVD